MDVESVQDRRGERVENRRPSEVFLALWRWRSKDVTMTFEEFAGLADTWAQIRELEEIAAREQRRGKRVFDEVPAWATDVRPFGATAPEPREGQAPPLQTPTEAVPDRVQDPEGGPPRAAAPTDMDDGGGVSESDRPMTEGDGKLGPTPAKKPNKARVGAGVKSVATRKRNILAALRHARADGVNLQTVADQVGGLTINSVMDVLDAKNLPLPVWTDVEKALKKLGYPPAAEAAGAKEAEA